jgi:rsbT co-antagonist protein RsbR
MNDQQAELLRTIEQLRAQNAVLEQQLSEQARAAATLQAVLDHVPYAIYWKDTDLRYLGGNQRFCQDIGFSSNEVVGLTDAAFSWGAHEVAAFEIIDRRILANRQPEYDDQETVFHPDGSQEWFETHKRPFFNQQGDLIGVIGSYNNITARKQVEATIAAQSALLQELSTPVIPLTKNILVVPLIGTIDTNRAERLTATILDRIAQVGAEHVFVDITGVAIIDTQVAHTLVQTSQAVQLLGSHMALTGIRPEVASTLVGLGVDLGTIITHSSLSRALQHILR